jgi:hypothetical protein
VSPAERRRAHNLRIRIARGVATAICDLCDEAEALRDQDRIDRGKLRRVADDLKALADEADVLRPALRLVG